MTISKQDSNLTGLRITEELTLGVLPTSPVPVWTQMEPNTYPDFGAQIKTIAREPISASRQLKRGAVVDLDAGGGLNQDLTMSNMTKWLQGFFFADIHEKLTTATYNAVAVALTAVTLSTKTYAVAAGMPTFGAGTLVNASGFTNSGNNGLKVVSSGTGTTCVVAAGVVSDETPPAGSKIDAVGFQFGSGTSAIAMNGNLVQLTDSGKDMTTFGFVLGEWVFIGGDTSPTTFANNVGFARISRVTTGLLEFDKTSWTGVAEAGTGKTIQLFYGDLLRNELDPTLIKRRTYQLERTLGNDSVGVMSEYLIGSVPNELTLNVPQAGKVTVDLTFLSLDDQQRTGTQGLKAGTRPSLVSDSAINTSSDLARIKLGLVDETNASITPLFAYSTDLKITVKNNASIDKALGVLGGFDVTVGNFQVAGTTTSYFADVGSVQAVRNNSDVTMDIIMMRPNKGIIFDIPMLGLGDGRAKVEKDKAITLSLTQDAAQSIFGNTLTYMSFSYLPTVAGS